MNELLADAVSSKLIEIESGSTYGLVGLIVYVIIVAGIRGDCCLSLHLIVLC
jgi:hypothetical protein